MPGLPVPQGRARVGAVVTSYQPGPELERVCLGVLPQVDVVVVVDDGSPQRPDELLDACRAAGVEVVVHTSNDGIGAALATGVVHVRDALAHVAEPGDELFVLTLDQDSVVPDGYVDALVTAAADARRHGRRVGLVGPEHVTDVGSMVAREEDGTLLGSEPIQSGLLVPLDLLDELHGFAVELFIDSVDSELYLHATTAGYDVVVAPGTQLGHRLGSVHDGWGRGLVHAAPFRYYYIARNHVLVIRRYWRSAPGWCARAVLKDARHLAVTTVLVPGRRARWRNWLAGVRDGVAGVTGRRPAAR